MGRKYLEDIGWQDYPPHPDDGRHEQWKEEREAYGFDETETWNLNSTLYAIIYERLKMYDEVNCVDTSFHKFEYKGEILTLQDCIDRILSNLELFLSEKVDIWDEEYPDVVCTAMDLLALCHLHLWW